jgi:hypothetical protein
MTQKLDARLSQSRAPLPVGLQSRKLSFFQFQFLALVFGPLFSEWLVARFALEHSVTATNRCELVGTFCGRVHDERLRGINERDSDGRVELAEPCPVLLPSLFPRIFDA